MKRYISFFLAALMLCSFAACKNSSAPAAEVTAEPAQEAPLPTETPAPTPLPQGETTSVMAGSILSDGEGLLWTSLAPIEGFTYVYDALPEDVGHVYSFLVHDGTIYAALKEDSFSMEAIRIAAFSVATGKSTLLAEDALGNSTFCLLGEDYILYTSDSGLRTIHLPTGELSEPLTGVTHLLTARNGSFYYTREDDGLYRNNSSLRAEEKLLDTCPSYWLCPGEDSLCSLTYTEEGTVAAVEFRGMDGTLRSRQPLSRLPMGICSDGVSVYVPQESENTIGIYDIATGNPTGSLPLPQGTENCLPLMAVGGTVYYQALTEGSFRIFCLGPENDTPLELASDIMV